MKLFKTILFMGMAAILATSCKNQDIDFPDYEGGVTVYFSHQYPVRTLVMGEDTYDTSLDNAHKCKIMATMGGAYKGKNIKVEVAVDNTLTDNLYFENGSPVKPMPSDYYSLAGNTLDYGGNYMGGVEVQFTDAFFADPAALQNTYVIPLVMKSQTGADFISTGTPLIEGSTPSRCDASAWDVNPMDYVLFCVKYINTWHASYLRRGVDQITENGKTTTNVRHEQYVEKDEVCYLKTATLDAAVFPVSTTVSVMDSDGKPTVKTLTCNMRLNFNDKGECTISSDSPEYPASGNGKFVKRGEKKSWGNQDRDALYLEYNIDFAGKKYATKDTLVVQARGVAYEEFVPTYQAN